MLTTNPTGRKSMPTTCPNCKSSKFNAYSNDVRDTFACLDYNATWWHYSAVATPPVQTIKVKASGVPSNRVSKQCPGCNQVNLCAEDPTPPAGVLIYSCPACPCIWNEPDPGYTAPPSGYKYKMNLVDYAMPLFDNIESEKEQPKKKKWCEFLGPA